MEPTFDPAAQANAQVTVAIVLAGFAFAGFILLIDKVRAEDRGSMQWSLYFQSMFLLAATFSIGSLAAFFYGGSLSSQEWAAHRSIQFAHTLFVLETFALVASVGAVLGIYATIELRVRAWWIMQLISAYSAVRMAFELARHVDMGGGSRLLVAGIFLVVLGPAFGLFVVFVRQLGSSETSFDQALHYVSGVAVSGVVVAAAQLTLFFEVDAEGHLPPTLIVVLASAIGIMFAWTGAVTRPGVRPEGSESEVFDATMPEVANR